MKLLNQETKLFHFKSINFFEKSNTLFLSFSQEEKYIITDSVDLPSEFINIGLMMELEDNELAQAHYDYFRKVLLDGTVHIRKLDENVIFFVGNGYDNEVKVVSYTEFEMDQTKEDWIDRYLYVCRQYHNLMLRFDSNRKMIEEIKRFIPANSNNDNAGLNNVLLKIIENYDKINSSYNIESALLTAMNQKLIKIEEKLELLSNQK